MDRVSHRGHRLQSVVVYYNSSVPHGLSVSLTMYLYAFEHHSFANRIFKCEFYPRVPIILINNYGTLYVLHLIMETNDN